MTGRTTYWLAAIESTVDRRKQPVAVNGLRPSSPSGWQTEVVGGGDGRRSGAVARIYKPAWTANNGVIPNPNRLEEQKMSYVWMLYQNPKSQSPRSKEEILWYGFVRIPNPNHLNVRNMVCSNPKSQPPRKVNKKWCPHHKSQPPIVEVNVLWLCQYPKPLSPRSKEDMVVSKSQILTASE